MKRLDRLGWAAGISFCVFGLRIGIRVSSRHALDLLYEQLPFGWEPEEPCQVDRLYSIIDGGATESSVIKKFSFLYADVRQIARTLRVRDIVDIMKSDIELYIAGHSPNHLFVHAGAVSWKGHAIVIPGRSMSGKSSLVNALLEAGANYLSDEFAVFDSKGKVYAFARPLVLRDSQTDTTLKGRNADMRARLAPGPFPLGMVILTSYRVDAHWKPRILTPAQGVLGLLAHAPLARDQPRRVLKMLAEAVSSAKVLKGMRGEARQTATPILRFLDSMLAEQEHLRSLRISA
jgi:hypothetical protein